MTGSSSPRARGLGKGATFSVTLPLTAPKTTEHTPKDLRPSAAASAVSLEYSSSTTTSMRRHRLSLLLQLGGHTTQLAHDGPEALRLVAEFKPDIVLLDIGFPGMNGYEVARAIRADPSWGIRFLVAVTGWGAPKIDSNPKQPDSMSI